MSSRYEPFGKHSPPRRMPRGTSDESVEIGRKLRDAGAYPFLSVRARGQTDGRTPHSFPLFPVLALLLSRSVNRLPIVNREIHRHTRKVSGGRRRKEREIENRERRGERERESSRRSLIAREILYSPIFGGGASCDDISGESSSRRGSLCHSTALGGDADARDARFT